MDANPQQCLISFGSNLGDRNALLAQAARIIAADEQVHRLACSRLFETPPIGGPGGQEPFLNAVAAFDTSATAARVLKLLQRIESQLGRDRKQRWGSRSIDLDVILHGQMVSRRHRSQGKQPSDLRSASPTSPLLVPHPRYTARRFVLRPACDVAGDYRDPRFGWTLRRLAQHLDQGVPSMSLAGASPADRSELCSRLRGRPGLTVFESSLPTHDTHIGTAWVSDSVPRLPPPMNDPPGNSDASECLITPRLIVRLHTSHSSDNGPVPGRIDPIGPADQKIQSPDNHDQGHRPDHWPHYDLELDDKDWAAAEIVSAIQSMRCPTEPITQDGNWWR